MASRDLYSFLETTPPRPTVNRDDNEAKKLKHNRSFSRFLFGSLKNKDEEKDQHGADTVSSARTPSKKLASGRNSSHKRHATSSQWVLPPLNVSKSPSPSPSPKSTRTGNFISVKDIQILYPPTTPTRPTTRPSLNILSDDPFIVNKSAQSSTKPTLPKIDVALSSIRSRGDSTSSNGSSDGPYTPADELHSPSGNTSSCREARQLPALIKNPLPPIPPVPAWTHGHQHTTSQPSTPFKSSFSMSNLTSQTAPRPTRPTIPHSQSCSYPRETVSSPVRSPTSASSISLPKVASPPLDPKIRQALIAQRQKYDALAFYLKEVESAKVERERRIAVLEEEAARRTTELEGLRWLIMNVNRDPREAQLTPEVERPLKRTNSMPLMSGNSPNASDQQPTMPDVPPLRLAAEHAKRVPKQAGLGIDVDVDKSRSRREGLMPPKSASAYTTQTPGSHNSHQQLARPITPTASRLPRSASDRRKGTGRINKPE